MDIQEVKHYQINGRYRVQFERSAVKGVIGYKVEANGDDYDITFNDAHSLQKLAELAVPVVEEKK